MAKKTTNKKISEPGISTVSKTVTKSRRAQKAQPTASKVVKSGLRSEPVTKPAPASVVTDADIALRAYYIGEKRQKLGIPGDSTSDWVQAERQLKAEAIAK
jgi:hypothetical protein